MNHTPNNGVSRDRQELWRLDSFLAVMATTPDQRERGKRLHRYLCETCDHEWLNVSGWAGCPNGTYQCEWCHEVTTPTLAELLDSFAENG